LIRFWPTGSTKAKALADYQGKIIALANASQDPVHANQLRVSAQREQAQAFSTTGPLKAVPIDQQVQIGKVA
jgi:hypothetical protein